MKSQRMYQGGLQLRSADVAKRTRPGLVVLRRETDPTVDNTAARRRMGRQGAALIVIVCAAFGALIYGAAWLVAYVSVP